MNKDEKTLNKEQKKLQRQNEIHPLKYKKAGVLLTRAEVAKIKASRKELHAKMKKAGIKDRKDKRILEVSSGAYFDRRRDSSALAWILQGRVLVALLVVLALTLTTIFLASEITKLKGHFTINITPGLFSEGFSIGNTLDPETGKLKNPTSELKGEAPDNTPCTTISKITSDIDKLEGPQRSENFFAYGFYIENRGKEHASYGYELVINSQSKDAAKVAWALLFIDGKAAFYAKPSDDGQSQTLPARDVNTRGYRDPPFIDVAAYPNEQYEIIKRASHGIEYYRLIALPFESEDVITSGVFENVPPGAVQKYTIVVWIEGDDPDCTNEIIGGHFGVEFNFIAIDD